MQGPKRGRPIKVALAWLTTALLGAASSLVSAQPTCSQLDGTQVFADEVDGYPYLGFLGRIDAQDSIMNPNDSYGDSTNASGSVRAVGKYGTATTTTSNCDGLEGFAAIECAIENAENAIDGNGQFASDNPDASLPPLIVRDGQILARLTTNPAISPGLPLSWIDSNCVGNNAFTSAIANGADLPTPINIRIQDFAISNTIEGTLSSEFNEAGGIRVLWGANNPSFADATGIQIEVSDSPTGPRSTILPVNIRNLDLSGSSQSAIIVGLVPGQEYVVWAALNNGAGRSQLMSSEMGTAQYLDADEPGPVTNLVATPGPERIRFDFGPPLDNGGKAILRYEYLLLAGADNRICPRSLAQSQNAGEVSSATSSSVVIEDLDPESPYTFCVVACNVDICTAVGKAELVSATTGSSADPPDAPTIDRIEFDGEALLIFFTPGAANGDAISLFNASCGQDLLGSGVNSPLSVAGAIEGESYECSLTATNGAGTGGASAVTRISAELANTGLNIPLLIKALEDRN